MRNIVRHRKSLTQESSRFILRMQKALENMNIKIHTVISDITGKTGTAIVNAILEGERKPENFLPLVDGRIKASREDILKSLSGNWRQDQLFLLEINNEAYKFFQSLIIKVEREIEETLKVFSASCNDGIFE